MPKPGNSSAWSYSVLTRFEQCPRKYYHLTVAKDVADTPGEAATWGLRVHKAAEDYSRGVAELPVEVAHTKPLIDRLMAVPGEKLVEHRIGVTAAFEPCDFFADNVWYRGVIDLAVVGEREALAVDYKTGKQKEDHDQLSLFAAAMFVHFPHIEQVRTAYLWLKTGRVTSKTFTRDENIWAQFIPRVQRIEIAKRENKFPVRPSGLCGWCPVKTCPHWVKR